MKVGLIGAGNMARALARGWGDPVLCSDSGSGRAAALTAELGGRTASNAEVAREADLVVLCHKPYQLDAVAAEIAGSVRAIASVLAGTPYHRLQDAYPGIPVFRLMPNTPVEVRAGVVCYAPAPGADAGLEGQVLELFGRLGSVVTVEDRLFGVASSVSSVGPAYQALLAEAQVDAAVRLGLKPAVASQLVVGTMTGSAALIAARDYDTLRVRREVTSPGGTTARGLDALERSGIRSAFSAAIDRVSEVA
jgi:pyrroline-5-carboxylate reductase